MERREFISLLGGAAAARGAGAAARHTGDRVSRRRFAQFQSGHGRVPTGSERNRLRRGPRRGHRISVGGRAIRSVVRAGG
jgi:hypothetical protein